MNAERKQPPARSTAKKGSRKKRPDTILIVDDEPDFTEAFRRMLEARSYHVLTATDRARAEETLQAEEASLVILGTLAPAGQTFAMYKWLEQHPRYRDVPVLVVDAAYDERAFHGLRRFEGVQMNPDDYVSKPVEPASLVPQIQSLLAAAKRRIKVLVVDDHTMVRTGICSVLALQKDMEVVGEAVNGQDGFDKAMRYLPDVALMDILMPEMSGIEATKLIRRECPQTKVLILTQYDEEENMIVAKQSGAYGFIPKKAASSDLITGIRNVSQGRFFPKAFAELVVQ